MATDMPAEIRAADDRWQRMWSHREQLLKVARRRSMSREDAEDAVHEAMLRAAERPDLDDERLAAWLTTVTMRLCVDRYRQVNREAEVRTSPTLVAPGPVPIEEAVCDRAEARWLARRSGELPTRQAEALRLKSEDLDVSQVADRMGLSYRTVESLLARARRTLRASLAGTLGFALFMIGRGRLRAGGKAQAVAATSAAAAGHAAPVRRVPRVGRHHQDRGRRRRRPDARPEHPRVVGHLADSQSDAVDRHPRPVAAAAVGAVPADGLTVTCAGRSRGPERAEAAERARPPRPAGRVHGPDDAAGRPGGLRHAVRPGRRTDADRPALGRRKNLPLPRRTPRLSP